MAMKRRSLEFQAVKKDVAMGHVSPMTSAACAAGLLESVLAQRYMPTQNAAYVASLPPAAVHTNQLGDS